MNITAIVILIPVIVGLVGVITQIGMPTKFAPIACIVLGYVLVCLLNHFWGAESILVGLVTGLAATGGHSGTVATVGAIQDMLPSSQPTAATPTVPTIASAPASTNTTAS